MTRNESLKRYEDAKARVFRALLRTVQTHDERGEYRKTDPTTLADCESLSDCFARLSRPQISHLRHELLHPAVNWRWHPNGGSWKEDDLAVLGKLEAGEFMHFSTNPDGRPKNGQ